MRSVIPPSIKLFPNQKYIIMDVPYTSRKMPIMLDNNKKPLERCILFLPPIDGILGDYIIIILINEINNVNNIIN